MRSKLFINTSDHEGFPNTFLQAWSRGIPVLSFVDPDDLIRECKLGLVVKSIDEMAQKLEEILNNRIEFSSQRIVQYFNKNLTIEHTVDSYEQIFHLLHNS